jgi:hypothetical protein
MTLLTKAEEISDVAFGFVGSKALFAALHHKVFTRLADGPMTAEEAAAATGLHPERVRTLLTALAALGVLSVENSRFGNSPAADSFLVKGAKYDFGDYLRLQVDRQMYSLLDQIELALADKLPDDATASYAEWFSDPEEARLYSMSQHAGSLGPALGPRQERRPVERPPPAGRRRRHRRVRHHIVRSLPGVDGDRGRLPERGVAWDSVRCGRRAQRPHRLCSRRRPEDGVAGGAGRDPDVLPVLRRTRRGP